MPKRSSYFCPGGTHFVGGAKTKGIKKSCPAASVTVNPYVYISLRPRLLEDGVTITIEGFAQMKRGFFLRDYTEIKLYALDRDTFVRQGMYYSRLGLALLVGICRNKACLTLARNSRWWVFVRIARPWPSLRPHQTHAITCMSCLPYPVRWHGMALPTLLTEKTM